jgi:hypothetical protein
MQQNEVIFYKGIPTNEDTYKKSVALVENTLSKMGLDEITELSDGDNQALIESMIVNTIKRLQENNQAEGKAQISHIYNALKEKWRKESIVYFIKDVFGDDVKLNWHHLHWAYLVENNLRIALLASRDHGKSFFWSLLYPIWMLYRYDKNDPKYEMCKKGFLISHGEDKAIDLLREIITTIEENPILRERLYPDGNAKQRKWSGGEIVTKNGANIKAKGFMTKLRGYHPQWIVNDDILTDQVIYSPTQRNKTIEFFYSVVENMLVPKGQMIVVGTPFHEKDIYSTFREKEKQKVWTYREYPAFRADGKILWEGRYDFDLLMQKRTTLGNVIFSREFLCKPIASDSSIFPYTILSNAIDGMENYKLVNNIEAFPMNFESVVMGCDFATSANVGADYTVFTVWGIDKKENMWLLNIFRKVGATFNEQIGMIKQMGMNFRPDIIIMEKNNFQTLYQQYLQNTALPIKPHNTGKEKNDFKVGLPSLAVLFERGKIKLPYGDERSKSLSDIVLSEFNSVTFTDKGLQGVGGHDDCAMSTWFGRIGFNQVMAGGFAFEFM